MPPRLRFDALGSLGGCASARALHARPGALAGLCLLAALACTPPGLVTSTAPLIDCPSGQTKVESIEGGRQPDSPFSYLARCGERRFLCSSLHERLVCDELPPGFEPDAERPWAAQAPSEPAAAERDPSSE